MPTTGLEHTKPSERGCDATHAPAVVLGDGVVMIDGVQVTDVEVVDLMSRHAEQDRPELVRRLLSIGARGLRSMGLRVGLDDIDDRIQSSVRLAVVAAQDQLAATIGAVADRANAELDPDRSSSTLSRALEQLGVVHEKIEAALDPADPDSSPGRLVERIEAIVGSDGALEERIRSLLDPLDAASASRSLASLLTDRITEIRDLIAEDRGRRDEASRGTRKGTDYEDLVDESLRRLAAPHGWWVERTTTAAGALHADSKVGDFVVHLDDGTRLVVEAKNSARIGLTGPNGILAELDRALANRQATLAICVASEEAYPAEVGSFGVYGDRILIVDDGDGSMLAIALRWASLTVTLRRQRPGRDDLDMDMVADRLQRLRNLTKQFSGTKRSLTQISASVDEVRSHLDTLRGEVSSHLDDLETHLLARPSNVVRLASTAPS